jgi:hypothetical protein
MDFKKTTPETLASQILANINRKVNYPAIPTDGAKEAAKLINELINQDMKS